LAPLNLAGIELRPQLLHLNHLSRALLHRFPSNILQALELIFRQLEPLPRPHDRLDVLSRDIGRTQDCQSTYGDQSSSDLAHR
jgi:hypothetical protein